jgi:hypothetical protein
MTEVWQRVKPQWARHQDGYEVYSDGTYQVAYVDSRGKALVAAERLVDGLVLDPRDVFWARADGSTSRVAHGDRAVIVQRCADAFRFLGSQVTISRG